MVIVFVLGVRSTGGFAARIERLRTDHRRMYVLACEEQPGSSCATTLSLTNPYHAVTTRRQDRPVELVHRVEIVECD
jgi:hypothetical protein